MNTNSCIYSYGQSSGLQPDFLISSPAVSGSHSGRRHAAYEILAARSAVSRRADPRRFRSSFIICPDSAEVKIFLTQINTRRIFRKSPVSPIDFPPSGVV